MALARSASGPGGLSINTGSANSLFGSNNTSQAPASGGLFGSASKPASGGLFGSTATTSAPQSQGLFGSATAPATGGLFGNTASTTTSAPQTGGLFGSATATSQTQPTAGLFGSSSATSQPQQSGGLFGNTNTSTTTATQPNTGLFGASTSNAQSTQPQASTGGLFGGMASTQPAASGGLFAGLNNQNKPAGSSLFGGNNATQPQQSQAQKSSGLFGFLNQPGQPAISAQPALGRQAANTSSGGLTMGQGTSQQQTVPGVRIDISNIRSTTRFNDLHEDLQKVIENIDKVILNSMQQSQDINAIMPSHSEQLSFVPDNVEFLSRKLIGVESSLETDAETIAHLKSLAEQDYKNANISFKAINELALPQQYHQRHAWNTNSALTDASSTTSQDLVNFFSSTADALSSKLTTYQSRMSEIEMHLRSVEAATVQQAQLLNSSGGLDDRGREIRELALVLREFEQGILGVAGEVGICREEMQKLQLGGFDDLRSQYAARTNANGKRSGIY